jgi:putative transposase
MAWKVSNPMDEKMKFIAEILKGEDSFADLCRAFGISRKTGYKWREPI